MRTHTSLPGAIALELINNLSEEEGFVIGKADVRYTLWQYSKNEEKLCLVYVHGLSSDINKVHFQWPDVYVCEGLRGNSWCISTRSSDSSSSKKSEEPVKTRLEDFDSLPFGKFAGVEFDKINDCGYWCWLANAEDTIYKDYKTGVEIDFRDKYIERALATGAELMFGRYYDPNSQYLQNKDWYQVAKSIEPHILKGEPFEFIATANKCSFWFGLPIYFKEEDTYSFYNYYGGGHYLVVTNKKGKRVNKRTKGHTIQILEYQYKIDNGTGKPYILVEKFNIK